MFPLIADTTPGWSTPGWSTTGGTAFSKTSFVLGDIDGDGFDELVTTAPMPSQPTPGMIGSAVQISHWIQTGWSPMAPIPYATLVHNYSNQNPGNAFIGPTRLHLADVDGDGIKEVVVSLVGQDQVYRYLPGFAQWSLLTSYTYDSTDTYVGWMHPRVVSKQNPDVRVMTQGTGSFTFDNFATGQWAAEPYSPVVANTRPANGCLPRGNSLDTFCAAFGDINGDGIPDMVYLGIDGRTYISPSDGVKPFTGVSPSTAVPTIDFTSSAGVLSPQVFQLGDMVGDGKSELMLTGANKVLQAFYYDSIKKDLVAVADPQNYFSTLSTTFNAVPQSYTTVRAATVGSYYGVAGIGTKGVFIVSIASSNGSLTTHDFGELADDISQNAGFAPLQYSSYLTFGMESNGQVLLARSTSGIVNRISSGGNFVDPNSLTVRGYPVYTNPQASAYEYISFQATHNPDIRSLYPDPAIPWDAILYKVETMAPPFTTDYSSSDFQFVQRQTIDEITSIQAVNLMYGVTGQILTDSYLVKDATLAEVTQALSLSSDPDVAGQVINDVINAANGLGAALSTVSSFLQMAKDAAKLASIINGISAAGNMGYLLGAITGDTATYSASSASADTGSGSYSLKTELDNLSLGAVPANTCNQLTALSAWNTSKPIADGVLSGAIPLDLGAAQDFVQAGQSAFRLTVWQTLAPSKWSYAAVRKSSGCTNCLFQGNSSYPVQYSTEASATCSYPTYHGPVSLILIDPSTNNYPNLTALDALFSAQPDGLGANPADVFFGNYGWSIPYDSTDSFFGNFFFNTGYTMYACGNLSPQNPQLTPNVKAAPLTWMHDLTRPGSEAVRSRLDTLISDVKSNVADAITRARFAGFLQSAAYHLEQSRARRSDPEKTIQLLNNFITQSQWHAQHYFQDSQVSMTESIEAVAIRDSLLNATGPDSAK
ncbi:MAG: VCBS repeat-containing protein [Acidobacteriaceae bacterium]|nr:VCBS repeat-containing protein [Acidobacteriaceae bacterium]